MNATAERPASATLTPPTGERAFLLWHDDNESGGAGWTHGDNTASGQVHFHVDTYYAAPGGDYSYWCGELNPGFTGGAVYCFYKILGKLVIVNQSTVSNGTVKNFYFRTKHCKYSLLNIWYCIKYIIL